MIEAIAAAEERLDAVRAERLQEQYGLAEAAPSAPRGGRR
jgi:hypothetical protein